MDAKDIKGIEIDSKTNSYIYPLDYLLRCEPTEDDIDEFYNGDSLYLSVVVNMWKFCGYETDTKKILEICRTDPRWMYNHTWTKEQRSEYEHMLMKIFMKCLDMDKDDAWHNIEQYSAFGGAFNLDDYSRENFDAYRKLVADISYDSLEDYENGIDEED